MIKKFLFLTFLISGLLAVSLLFSACGHDRTHVHNLVWESDRLYHWASCECGEKIEKTMHSYSYDTCDICEAEIIASEGLEFALYRYFIDDYTPYVGYAVAAGECTDSEIVIPATYNGYPVIAIQEKGFSSKRIFMGYDYDYIERVLLPEGIKKIENSAFYYSCPNLE